MTDLKDYYISGVTIGMSVNNTTKIILKNDNSINSYEEIAQDICEMTNELLKEMCKQGLIPKKTINKNVNTN